MNHGQHAGATSQLHRFQVLARLRPEVVRGHEDLEAGVAELRQLRELTPRLRTWIREHRGLNEVTDADLLGGALNSIQGGLQAFAPARVADVDEGGHAAGRSRPRTAPEVVYELHAA